VPWPATGAPDDVRIWRLDLDLDLSTPLPAEVVSSLNDAERARLKRYLRHEDKVRFGVTRAALKRLLAGYAAASHIELTYNGHGRPVWQGSGLNFNVTHSGTLALIVISDRRHVGIDVEQRRHLDIDSLVRLVLTPHEQRALEQMPAATRQNAFYDYWVCKEAALKATGRGIGDALQRIEVRRDAVTLDGSSIHCDDAAMADSNLLRSLALRMLPLPKGYTGAVAWASGADKIDMT
jgi:4'-phosphopantetheinyl transferase